MTDIIFNFRNLKQWPNPITTDTLVLKFIKVDTVGSFTDHRPLTHTERTPQQYDRRHSIKKLQNT